MLKHKALPFAAFVVCFGYQVPAQADATWPATINIGIQKGDPLVALRASGELEKAFAQHGVAVKWMEFVCSRAAMSIPAFRTMCPESRARLSTFRHRKRG
ncbi:hypothetical protein [Paraburkholderia youngii]|uniref:hypothetical protein n=1 Tax=Paraburkholderia youngii TaxID=2782701 RepID=UPI0020CDC6CF|nr:hypothetical protein [Paraburkholderia youngii]